MITDRIDAVTKIPLSYRHEYLPAPKSVKIELTATCNLACSMCVRSLHDDKGDMPREMFSRLIHEISDYGTPELGLFYVGESMLLKWLPDAISEARPLFEYLFLTTNGTAATPERVEQCMKAGLDSLKFSINFADEQQFAKETRSSPKLWRKAIDNLKAARKIRDDNGYKTKLYASSIKFDGEQGKKMQAVVDEITPHVDQFYWLPLYGMSGASKASGWTPQPGNPGRLGAMREPLPCWAVFTEAHITKDGMLAACCFGNGADDSLAMADLKEVTFRQGWNSEKFRALRKAHLAKNVSGTGCEGCIAG